MLYKKILGLFKTLPLEKMTVDWICDRVNEDKSNVLLIIERLKKEGHIKGVRKLSLSGEHLKHFKKYCDSCNLL